MFEVLEDCHGASLKKKKKIEKKQKTDRLTKLKSKLLAFVGIIRFVFINNYS